jgi:WD40 repeat protein/tRNA A-37 threonylcarbamoyl transferase component Bud32
MAEALLCPQCGKTVPADAPQGLCPACMMRAGLDGDLAERRTKSPVAPSTQEAVTLPPQAPAAAGDETVAPPEGGFGTQPASSASGATPANVPGYEILGELGRGGMGIVYKARQTKLRRIVALKMILAGGHAGSAELARFRTEAEAIARLQHPNIVQVHEIGEHEGKPYFSLEFCAGGSLAQKLNGTPWPAQDAARIVETLAHAMDAAHQKGVIHRDLKPANILLSFSREPPASAGQALAGGSRLNECVAKITDFGLAKKLDEAGQTQSGAIMGTPSYMAPEQAGGKGKEVGPAADVYALGAILYELLTGRPPFKAATALDTLLQVVSDDPVPPSQLQSKTSKDLETICLKCLAKAPAKRYATAHELADDLRRFLAGEPILARPVGSVERLWRWCQRKPAQAIATGVAVCGVLLALVAFAGAFFAVSDALDNETNERKKAEQLADEKDLLAKREKKLADANKLLAEKAEKARVEADHRREQAESLAVRVEFEHYFSKADDRSDVAMVGMASLLPKAARLKDQRLAASLRVHIGAVSEGAARLNAICAHEGWVVAVAVSADGKTALTGSWDNTARLWDTASGKPIGPPLRHQGIGQVNAVALSADGKTGLTGGADKTAQLWDAATGKPIGPPLPHQGEVLRVALSADGKTALTGSRDKTARVWNTATGKPIGPPLQHQDMVMAVALSANGKTVLTGSNARTLLGIPYGEARLWEAATGKLIGQPLQHQREVYAVAVSADGKTALTGSYAKEAMRGSNDQTAQLWDTASGKPIGPPLPHQGWVMAVALSADGKTALTGSEDKTARLWDAARGKPIGPPLQHQAAVRAVALSGDGTTALTGSLDYTARLWDTATSKPIGVPLAHQNVVQAVALSADGKTALTGSVDNTARVWKTAAAKPIGPALQHKGRVQAVALSADGKTVLMVIETGGARLWDTVSGKPIGPPLMHLSVEKGPKNEKKVINTLYQIQSVALSADGKTALTGGMDNAARLWDTVTGKRIGPTLQIGPPLEHPRLGAVALSADGKTALTGSDAQAQLWDTATGKPLGPPLLHQEWIGAVALSADGKTALTGSQDKTARLWDTATGKPIGLPLQHQGVVEAVALSADGKTALTGCRDKTARLWETATGKPIGPPLEHQDMIRGVALSADGKTALTGSSTARLWETATGKPIGGLLQHQGFLHHVALSADGKTALTVSDGKTRLWHFPQPMRGDPERIMLWAQVITGLEVDELTAVRFLDAATWQQRRQRLQELGGPPDVD